MNSVEELLEVEKIMRLKHSYFRYLDMKQFEKLVLLFAEDATTAYDNGRYSFTGREAILKFMNEGMALRESPTLHQGHHPEINLIDENRANGTWHFEDVVIRMDFDIVITGAGIFFDEYVKIDGEWKIQHTGYERLWFRQEKLPEDPSRVIRVMYDPEERENECQKAEARR